MRTSLQMLSMTLMLLAATLLAKDDYSVFYLTAFTLIFYKFYIDECAREKWKQLDREGKIKWEKIQ